MHDHSQKSKSSGINNRRVATRLVGLGIVAILVLQNLTRINLPRYNLQRQDVLHATASNSSMATATTTTSLTIGTQGAIERRRQWISLQQHQQQRQSSQSNLLLDERDVNGYDKNSRHDKELNHHLICSSLLLPRGASASVLWRRHVTDILQASIDPVNDRVRQVHRTWMQQLLTLIPPRLLQRGIRASPNHDAWIHLLNLISQRMQQQRQQRGNTFNSTLNNTTTATTLPPIQVVVFGGSVTLGRECYKLPPQLLPFLANVQDRNPRHGIMIADEDCAWPNRLQWLLDHFLGQNVVQIYNYAAGGTDTECSLPKIQYQLYQSHHTTLVEHGPDVIINAYSTNDNHYNGNNKEDDDDDCHDPLQSKCMWHQSQNLTRQFTSASLQFTSRQCPIQQHHPHNDDDATPKRLIRPPPLILYMDDYLGAVWSTIPVELQRHEAVQEQLQYHGLVGHVSTIPVLSHLVWSYPETMPSTAHHDSSSSPFLLSTPRPPQHAHFGMPGHVARAWIFAYAILQWTVDTCQDEYPNTSPPPPPRPNHQAPPPPQADRANKNAPGSTQTPFSWSTTTQSSSWPPIDERHMLRTTSPLPPLISNLRMAQISFEWKQLIQKDQDYQRLTCANLPYSTLIANSTTTQHHDHSPCSFAFVAGPGGTHWDTSHFRSFILPYLKSKYAWRVQVDYKDGFSNSLGLVAVKPNANVMLRVAKLTSSVQVITLHYLKSYGEKWINSMVLFQLYIQRRQREVVVNNNNNTGPELITSWELSGYHRANTSVSRVHRVDIGTERAAQVGDVVELHMRLIGGTSFKLRSLLLCHR